MIQYTTSWLLDAYLWCWAEYRAPLHAQRCYYPQAFFTNSDFNFIAPTPSMRQSMSWPSAESGNKRIDLTLVPTLITADEPLIFKSLIDDKENYEYLTTMSESTEQTNSIMLDLILTKYSRKYRKFKRSIEKSRKKVWTHQTNILNNCKEKSDFDNSMLDYNCWDNHLVNKYEYENYLQSLRSINQ